MAEMTKELCNAKHDALQETLTKEIEHVHQAIDKLERNTDAKHLQNVKTLGDISAQMKIANGRVGKLEVWRSWMSGALAAIGLLMPFIVAWFTWWLMGGK